MRVWLVITETRDDNTDIEVFKHEAGATAHYNKLRRHNGRHQHTYLALKDVCTSDYTEAA